MGGTAGARSEADEGGDVLVDRRGAVTAITLNRPAKRNALTFAMMSRLAAALEAASADDDVTVVLLGAAGGTFCAGNDLADMAAHPDLADDAPPLLMLRALRTLDAVLVARVDGAAIGVGATLLLHCDLVYATVASSLRFPFVALGLVPEAASTLLLPRLVGHQRASEAMLLGRPISAAQGQEWGLFTAIAPTVEALELAVDDAVTALLAQPREAVLATRRLLHDESTSTVTHRMELDSQVLRRLLGGPTAGCLESQTKER